MTLVIFDWGRTLFDPEKGALFDDTRPTLEYLKGRGFKIAIVALATAGQYKIDERMEIIEREHIQQYFDSIMFDVANKDEMYERTLRELRAVAEDVTVVDDRVVRGIAWGNMNGCTTVWVQNGKFAHELPDAKTGSPDYTITSVGELRSIL